MLLVLGIFSFLASAVIGGLSLSLFWFYKPPLFWLDLLSRLFVRLSIHSSIYLSIYLYRDAGSLLSLAEISFFLFLVSVQKLRGFIESIFIKMSCLLI